MKVRTLSISIPGWPTSQEIRKAAGQFQRAADHFNDFGLEVQSCRLALDHWDHSVIGNAPRDRRAAMAKALDAGCAEAGIEFCSLGVVTRKADIEQIGELIASNSRLNSCVVLKSVNQDSDAELVQASARAIQYLAANTSDGGGNFRFGIGFQIGPHSPFVPGPYHDGGEPCFTIGFENSDLLVEAFRTGGGMGTLRSNLFKLLNAKYQEIERSAVKLSSALGLKFGGMDTSIAPSLVPAESIVEAFRFAGVEFGEFGTLALCGLVTGVLKSIEVKRVGYCGIMLPILEDVGLARAAVEGRLGIAQVLSYASVCGVGVDMVALPGNVSAERLQALIRDVGTMAGRLQKPLLVRVLPVPGKSAGELTNFSSQYISNSNIMR
ncbi:MAG TPA: DUF711 family protein [Bryobacteraceae bacterium]